MLRTYWRRWLKCSSRPVRRHAQPRTRLLVESLEERALLSADLISINAAGNNSANVAALIPLFPINTDTTAGGNFDIVSADGRYVISGDEEGRHVKVYERPLRRSLFFIAIASTGPFKTLGAALQFAERFGASESAKSAYA